MCWSAVQWSRDGSRDGASGNGASASAEDLRGSTPDLKPPAAEQLNLQVQTQAAGCFQAQTGRRACCCFRQWNSRVQRMVRALEIGMCEPLDHSWQLMLCAQRQRVATGTLAADEERNNLVKAGSVAVQKRRWPGQRLVGPIVGCALNRDVLRSSHNSPHAVPCVVLLFCTCTIVQLAVAMARFSPSADLTRAPSPAGCSWRSSSGRRGWRWGSWRCSCSSSTSGSWTRRPPGAGPCGCSPTSPPAPSGAPARAPRPPQHHAPSLACFWPQSYFQHSDDRLRSVWSDASRMASLCLQFTCNGNGAFWRGDLAVRGGKSSAAVARTGEAQRRPVGSAGCWVCTVQRLKE